MNSLRICNEKYSSVKQIKVIDNKYKSSKYKAAFLKNFIWKSDSEIKIKFLEDIKNITWTPIPDLQKENRPIDPLEYEVRKLSPKMAVIKTVKERIIPISNQLYFQIEVYIEDCDGVVDLGIASRHARAVCFVGEGHLTCLL